MAQYGPPSIAGTIDSTVDAIGGGIRDYRTGQALENLPKTADGSIDYRAAATAMYRVNPALAAQFLKMEEMKGLQDYRKQSLGIQQQHVDLAKDKSQNIQAEGKIFHIGPNGQLKGTTDIETGVFTAAGRQAAVPQAPPQAGPREPPKEAIDILKQRPNTAAQFEKTFGLQPGGSQQYLGGGTTAAPAAVQAPAPPPQRQPSTAAPILQPPPGLSYSQRQEWTKNRVKEQSSVDNAELKKADDAIQSGRNTLTTIGEMLELNKRAFHGPAAQLRGTISSLTGIGGKQAGADTVILQNKITGGALEQLRATFGGNPTEGERAILLQVQGSVGQAADVRERIFKDAADLVRRRIMFNQKYANAQRKGQYMDPNYTDNTPVD
jgi:hypothetical protein